MGTSTGTRCEHWHASPKIVLVDDDLRNERRSLFGSTAKKAMTQASGSTGKNHNRPSKFGSMTPKERQHKGVRAALQFTTVDMYGSFGRIVFHHLHILAVFQP